MNLPRRPAQLPSTAQDLNRPTMDHRPLSENCSPLSSQVTGLLYLYLICSMALVPNITELSHTAATSKGIQNDAELETEKTPPVCLAAALISRLSYTCLLAEVPTTDRATMSG